MIYAYIHPPSMLYPIFEGELRLLFPEITEDQTGDTFPCPHGYFPVLNIQPTIGFDHPSLGFEELYPIKINGNWERQWSYYNLDQDTISTRAKNIQRSNDLEFYEELRFVEYRISLDLPEKVDLKNYADELRTWLEEFPRVREKPTMSSNSEMLTNPGSTPDVIG